LEFNACQWLHCVKRIEADWKLIQKTNRLMLRYEDLIQTPRQKITQVLDFLGLDAHKTFFESLPELKADNYNKWKTEFSKEDLKKISPIVTPQLKRFAYAETEEWINGV
jgi:hypothetical protein